MAGRLPLGVQPTTPTRSAQHADSSKPMAQERKELRSRSSSLGVSGGRLGAQGRLPGHSRSARTTLEDRQDAGWRKGTHPARRRPLPRLLLFYPRPRNRPFDPAFDDRRTLDRNPKLRTQNGKDVPRQNGKHVVRLYTQNRDMGNPNLGVV